MGQAQPRMMFFQPSMIGIDLHDHLIQFVEVKKTRSGFSLESYNRLALEPGIIKEGQIEKPDLLKLALEKLFATANPRAVTPREAAVVLPSNGIFTHIFEFPGKLSDKDLCQSLPFEAETVIPFSIQEVYWDMAILELQNEGSSSQRQKVLFGAVPMAVADKYAEVLNAVGITPVSFGIDLDAIQQALAPQLQQADTVLVIELNALSVNYTLIQKQVIKSFYSSNESIQDFLEDEAIWTKELSPEKEKAVDAFLKRKYHRAQKHVNENLFEKKITKLDRVLLTGEYAHFPHFYNAAVRYFPNAKIQIGDPKHALVVDDKKFLAHLEGNQQHIPYSICFTNPIGIAIKVLKKVTKEGLNLLPTHLKRNLHEERLARFLAFFAALMSLTSVVVAGFVLLLHQSATYERVNLEIHKTAVERKLFGTRYMEVQEALTTFNNEVSALSAIDKALFSVPNLLNNLTALAPEGIELIRIRFFDTDLRVEWVGIAKDRDQLLALKNVLEAEPTIKSVEMPLSNFDQKIDIPFQVSMTLDFSKLPPYATNSIQ